MKNQSSHQRVRRLTQISLLFAIELILGLTPLGLIVIPPISLTIMHIPVIIAGIVLGPLAGGIIGGTFGLIAMFKATTQAVSPADMLFSPFLSGNPLGSLVMCLVTRILVGVLAAVLFQGLMKALKQKAALCAGITAVLATILHTVMVLGCFYAFFGGIMFYQIFATLITLNGSLEIAAAALVATPVSAALVRYLKTGG